METNKILQSDYLDLIFDKRNKVYGGYELRKHYNRRALKALGITLSVLVFGIGTPFLISKLNAKEIAVANNRIPPPVELTEIYAPPPPADIPPPPKPAEAGTPPVAKTVIFAPPVIVPPNVNPEVKPPDMKELETSVAGTVKHEGEGGEAAATSDAKHIGPFGDGVNPNKNTGTGDAMNSNEPVKFAEVMPEYPGGMAALLDFLQKNMRYPAAATEDGIEGRVTVSFIVNTTGEIEHAKVVRGIGGGCDKEALRVVNAMPKWKPGKQNGHFVKVYYTLPISFKLQ